MVLAPCRISLPLPDLVREVAVILSARSELTVRSEELFWSTIRSAPPGPFSVPPVKAVAPLPVTSNPPEERVSVLPALRVIVVAAVQDTLEGVLTADLVPKPSRGLHLE